MKSFSPFSNFLGRKLLTTGSLSNMAFPAQPCVSAHSRSQAPWADPRGMVCLPRVMLADDNNNPVEKQCLWSFPKSLNSWNSWLFPVLTHKRTLVLNPCGEQVSSTWEQGRELISPAHPGPALHRLKKTKAAQKGWGGKVQFLLKTDSYFRVIHVHFGGSQKEALLRQLTFKSSCFWS